MGKNNWCDGQWGLYAMIWQLALIIYFFRAIFNSISYSVRFKIVWFHWCWCYIWTTFWFIVRDRNGLDGTMYAFFCCIWELCVHNPCMDVHAHGANSFFLFISVNLDFLSNFFLFPDLLLFASVLMEFAAQSSKRINMDTSFLPEELSPIRSFIFCLPTSCFSINLGLQLYISWSFYNIQVRNYWIRMGHSFACALSLNWFACPWITLLEGWCEYYFSHNTMI